MVWCGSGSASGCGSGCVGGGGLVVVVCGKQNCSSYQKHNCSAAAPSPLPLAACAAHCTCGFRRGIHCACRIVLHIGWKERNAGQATAHLQDPRVPANFQGPASRVSSVVTSQGRLQRALPLIECRVLPKSGAPAQICPSLLRTLYRAFNLTDHQPGTHLEPIVPLSLLDLESRACAVLCVAHLCRRCLLDASSWCLGVWFPSFFSFLWVPSQGGGRGASRTQARAPRPRPTAHSRGATIQRPTGFWSAHLPLAQGDNTSTFCSPFWLPSFCCFSSLSFPLLLVAPSVLHFPCLCSPQTQARYVPTCDTATRRHSGGNPHNGPLLRGQPCH